MFFILVKIFFRFKELSDSAMERCLVGTTSGSVNLPEGKGNQKRARKLLERR